MQQAMSRAVCGLKGEKPLVALGATSEGGQK
jgi:hypothetical protein